MGGKISGTEQSYTRSGRILAPASRRGFVLVTHRQFFCFITVLCGRKRIWWIAWSSAPVDRKRSPSGPVRRHIASPGQRQQYRSSPTGAEKENAARRALSGNEGAKGLREAFGTPHPRKGRRDQKGKEVGEKTGPARRPSAGTKEEADCSPNIGTIGIVHSKSHQWRHFGGVFVSGTTEVTHCAFYSMTVAM